MAQNSLILTFLLILLTVNYSNALYDKKSPVIQLTKDNFDELVMKSKDLWFVEFYAPWCGHCKALAPEYEKAAKSLEGIVKVGAVDMTEHGQVGAPYNIQGYPTIKFFKRDKSVSPNDYNGGRKEADLVKYAMKQIQQTVGTTADDDGDEKQEEKKEDENADDGWDKEADPFVQIINKDNFDSLIMESEEPWFLKFYAPWCSHCKEMHHDWSEAAKTLKGEVNIAKLDVTINHPDPIAQRVEIDGYPTLKFFPPGEKDVTKAITYKGPRKAKDIIDWSRKQVKRYERLKAGEPDYDMDGDVYVLESFNFDKLVSESKDPWLVEFYAPWCGHCKSLAPEYSKLATLVKGQVKIGKVNADEAENRMNLGKRFNIQGFPTLIYFPSGKKSDDAIINYDGTRTAESIQEWLLQQKKEIEQVISQEIYKKNCIDRRGVCIVSFLPHILDSTEDDRRRYLGLLLDVQNKFKGKPFNFVWSQGGDQYETEEKFALGSGFPVVLAINESKKVYSIMRASFTEKNLSGFLNDLLNGKEKTVQFRFDVQFKKTKQWIDEEKEVSIDDDENEIHIKDDL